MVDTTKIETLLQIHGISPSTPDEEIRSILFSAKYNDDEIDTALTVIRQNKSTKKDRIDGLRKIYRSDEALTPSQISALLGIELTVDMLQVKAARKTEMPLKKAVILSLLTVAFAFLGLLFALYMSDSGPFHPTVAAFRL